MVIGIDGNEANVERKVGISEYAFELLKEFYEIRNSNIEISNKYKIKPFDSAHGKNIKYKIYLKDIPRLDMPKETDWWKYEIVGPRKLWTQIGLPLNLYFRKPRPDVFFSLTHYAPRFSPVPTAIAIMDMSFVKYSELFAKRDLYQLTKWTYYSAKNAKKVFTISKASKDDILKEYHVPEENVIVTYPGIKSVDSSKYQVASMDELKKKYKIGNEYILFVGTIQPRKNIARLIEAFSKIVRGPAAHHPPKVHQSHSFPAGTFRGSPIRVTPSQLQLVIVGKKGWLYEEILNAPEKYGVSKNVIFLDYVPNEDLPALYKNALCYVLPSLYEGFGLPVLEAMQYGCPVITSNVSSLPEAGGDAALYVDPQSTEDITDKIKLVLDSKKLREEMVKKGYQHLKKFSWEKAAKETLEVLTSLVE